MSKSIVTMKGDDLIVGTWDLANKFGCEHRYLKNFVVKYKKDFEEFGVVADISIIPPSKKGGRNIEQYELSEEQATYLIMLMKNTKEAVQFKMWLHKEFFRQRRLLNKIIVQKQNAEWLEKRASGKIERRIETDAIKDFISYAKEQGSKNADKYYMAISKMENKTLFQLELLHQKYGNLRELLTGFALDSLKMADFAVGRAIKEGMEQKMNYKDIYELAKKRVEIFASVIGKMPIDVALGNKLEMKQ